MLGVLQWLMAYFSLVPAAGGGSRMGAECPKQYLPLLGLPLIHHTLSALAANADLTTVYVVLSPEDEYWQSFDWTSLAPRVRALRCGGATRAESVANGLAAMAGEVAENDWVLVHDAARPCLAAHHLRALMSDVGNDAVGGLLAVPVADTLKRADESRRVAHTVPRDGLWQAQTPQMFRYGLLRLALANAPAVTDEAGAVEAMGLSPRLVAADATNLKVTYPLDLQLAEWILKNREASCKSA